MGTSKLNSREKLSASAVSLRRRKCQQENQTKRSAIEITIQLTECVQALAWDEM
jgi:hypothetical protein